MARIVKKSEIEAGGTKNSSEREKLAKRIIEEEAKKLFIQHNVKIVYDEFSAYTKLVFIYEEDDSPEIVTREMIKPMEERIMKEVDDRIRVGIKYRTIYVDD